MFTSFGFFSLTTLLLLSLAVTTALYLIRHQIFALTKALCDFAVSLLTTAKCLLSRQARTASRRFLDLRELYIEEHNHSGAAANIERQWQRIGALQANEPENRFRLERVASEIRETLAKANRYPVEAMSDEGLDADDAKALTKQRKNALASWQGATGEMRQIRLLLRRLDRLARIDAARIEQTSAARADQAKCLEKLIVQHDSHSEPASVAGRKSIFAMFLLYAFFIGAAVVGTWANAQLLYFPFTEILGDGEAIRGVRTAYAGAVAFIVLEIVAGAMALEGFGITRFRIFEVSQRLSYVIGCIGVVLLLVLAGAEAVLVESRADIVAGDQQLAKALGIEGGGLVESSGIGQVSRLGQVAFAFCMPLALALAAIPLQHFLRTGRIVAQFFWSQILALGAALAGAARRLIRALRRIVDALFMLLVAVPALLFSLLRPIGMFFAELFRAVAGRLRRVDAVAQRGTSK